MKPDEIDHILSRETEIVPSSGFTNSVMAAVRSEAVAPPPIPFPWKRALPGLAVWVAAVVSLAADDSRWFDNDSVSTAVSTTARLLIENAQTFGAGWILLTLLMTGACLKLTSQLCRRGL